MVDDDEIGVEQNELIELLFCKVQQNGIFFEEEVQYMMQYNYLFDWMQEICCGKVLVFMVGVVIVIDLKGNVFEFDCIQFDGIIVDKQVEEDVFVEDFVEKVDGKVIEEFKVEEKVFVKKMIIKKIFVKKFVGVKVIIKKVVDVKFDDKFVVKKFVFKKKMVVKDDKFK